MSVGFIIMSPVEFKVREGRRTRDLGQPYLNGHISADI